VQAASSAVLVVAAAAAAEDGSLQAAIGAADFVFQKKTHKTKNKKSTKSECKMGLFVLGCTKSLQLEEENAKDLVRGSEALESGSSSSSTDLCPCVD
jgi:hypothetical protein